MKKIIVFILMSIAFRVSVQGQIPITSLPVDAVVQGTDILLDVDQGATTKQLQMNTLLNVMSDTADNVRDELADTAADLRSEIAGTGAFSVTGDMISLTSANDSMVIGTGSADTKFTIQGNANVVGNFTSTDTVYVDGGYITTTSGNLRLGDSYHPTGVTLGTLATGAVFTAAAYAGQDFYYLTNGTTYNMHIGGNTVTPYKFKVTGDQETTGSYLVGTAVRFPNDLYSSTYSNYSIKGPDYSESEYCLRFQLGADTVYMRTSGNQGGVTTHGALEADVIKLRNRYGSFIPLPLDDNFGKLRVTSADSSLLFGRGSTWLNLCEGAGIVHDTIDNDSLFILGNTHFTDSIYMDFLTLGSQDTVILLAYGTQEIVDSASLVPAARAWTDKREPFEKFYAKSKEMKALPLPYSNGHERWRPNAANFLHQFEYELERNLMYDKELRDKVAILERENNYLRKRPNKKVINELLLRVASLEKRVDTLERSLNNK